MYEHPLDSLTIAFDVLASASMKSERVETYEIVDALQLDALHVQRSCMCGFETSHVTKSLNIHHVVAGLDFTSHRCFARPRVPGCLCDPIVLEE